MKQLYLITLIIVCMAGCKKSANTTPKGTDTTATQKFTITASSGPNGGITPYGKTACNAGAQVQYAITPIAGYNVATLSVDGVAVTPATTYTFTNVQADHTISVTFLQSLTVTATAGPNGTVTPTTQVVSSGNGATVTFAPATTYHTDSLWVDGTFVKVLAGATTYTISNVTANHAVKVSFSDILSQKQSDSLSNLLVGQWTMVQLNSKLGNLQDVVLPWDIQPFSACSSNQFDQFYANGVFQRNNNPAACDPLAVPGQQQFVPRPLNHWKLKNNGKAIYLTDPPVDSLTNITVTKDSLIVFFYGGFDAVRGISYKYHYARKP